MACSRRRPDGLPPRLCGNQDLAAVIVAEAALSLVSGSVPSQLTVAVFEMTVPPGTSAFSVATNSMVADTPPGSNPNVTVRLLPSPAQTPSAVERQDTNVIDGGGTSATTTVRTAIGVQGSGRTRRRNYVDVCVNGKRRCRNRNKAADQRRYV
jgi:hypothetical protein